MPNRKWRLGRPTSYREAKEARGNLEYRKDMAEARESQKKADSTIKSMETLMGAGKAFKKIGPAKEAMDELKRQKKRKNLL
tara:strand:+ start:498 stop:740 length:243 start_codon:yes stop_codon:yes gene_type:complete